MTVPQITAPSEAVALASPAREPVRPAFTAGLTLAQVGAYLSFMPLLSILVPLKATAIGAADKASIMAQVSFWGALMAGAANLLAGAVSDRTLSRLGRRRPWIIMGLAGTVTSYFVIRAAEDFWGLLAGLLLFQFCFNFLFSPLVAILADRVPDAQKGRVSAFTGLAPPLGAALGALLTGVLIRDVDLRYLAIAVVLVLAIGPFALVMRDPPSSTSAWLGLMERQAAPIALRPHAYPDFVAAGLSRLFMQFAITVSSIYALFYLQDRVRYAELFPGASAEAGLAILTAVSTTLHIAAGLTGGVLSDRLKRRKPFVILGGLSLAIAMLLLAFWPSWPGALLAFAFLGCGFGLYATVDIALVAQLLPSLPDAARDLGLLNLANTIPQVLVPLLGLALLHFDRSYTALFACGGASALIGALLVNRIRTVR